MLAGGGWGNNNLKSCSDFTFNLSSDYDNYEGQSKITESWLVSFDWVGTFD